MENKYLKMIAMSNLNNINANWDAVCMNILECSKKIRRSWKQKDISRLAYLIELSQEFKAFPFYKDVTVTYGLIKIFKIYMRKMAKQSLLRINEVGYGNSDGNGRIYNPETLKMLFENRDGLSLYLKDMPTHPELTKSNIEVSSTGSIPDLNVKFTVDIPDDKSDYSNTNDVNGIVRMLSTWRDYLGSNEPLDRMVYRGGGYEPY
jgi:hypothetical protein